MKSKPTFYGSVFKLLTLLSGVFAAEAADFSIDKNSYSVDDVIQVTWSNSPGNAFDWFGVFQHPGPVNSNTYTDWLYTSGSQSPDAGVTNGSIAFALTVPVGDYAMVFLNNNGYDTLADPIPFKVVDMVDPPAEPVDLAATLSDPTQAGTEYRWTWQAPVNSYVEFNTFGSTTGTRLIVRGHSDFLVAENDDAFPPPFQGHHPTPNRSAVIFRATANETYKISVNPDGGQAGELKLNVLPVLNLPPAVALRETAIVAPDDVESNGLVDQDIRGNIDFFRSDEEPPRYYGVHDVLMPNPGFEDRIKYFLVKEIKRQATTEYDIPYMLSWNLFPSPHEPATIHTQDRDGWARIGKTAFQSYDLQFRSVAGPGQLPTAGNRLVIVSDVGGSVHIRIFDANGDIIIDKPENELITGNALIALKNESIHHADFPDESRLVNNLLRQRIIENATVSAGPPLKFVTADEAAGMQLAVFRNPFSPLANPTLAVEGYDGCTRDRGWANSNELCHGGQHSRDVVITAVSAYYPHRYGYIDNERTIDEQSWQRGQGWGVTYGPSSDLDENEGKLRVRIDGADNAPIEWQLFQNGQQYLDAGLPVLGDTAISEAILPADDRYEIRFNKPEGYEIMGVMNGSTYDIIKANADGTYSILEDRELQEGQSDMTQFGGLLVKQGQIADVRVQYVPIVRNLDLTTLVNPAGSGVVTGAGIFAEGSTVPIEATAADGYRFVSWTGEGISDPGASSTMITIAPDALATANFIKVWDLTLTLTDADAGTVTGGGAFDEGSEVPIEALASEGYRFVRWLGEGVADPTAATTSVDVSAMSTVTAQFVKVWDVTATVDPEEGGVVSGAGIYDDGASATLEALPSEGFRFLRWLTEGIADATSPMIVIEIANAASVTAQFVKVWDLEVTSLPADSGTVTGGGTFDEGSTTPIEASAAEGYRFDRWTGEGIADPTLATTSIDVLSSGTVVANFVKVWELQLNADPTAGGTVTGSGIYDAGEGVAIAATAADGFQFVSWVGEAVEDLQASESTVILRGDQVITAQFVPVWELILIADPANGGTIAGAGTFATGLVADIQAIAAEGFQFVKWRGDGAMDPGMANTSVTISTETTLVAEFERVSVDTDQDGDGIDDVWELSFGLDPNDPSDALLDRDGDGQSALAEFLAGTDPGSAKSVFAISGTRFSDPRDALILDWASVSGVIYAIQSAHAPDFQWIEVDSVVGNGEMLTYAYSVDGEFEVELIRLVVKASQGE